MVQGAGVRTDLFFCSVALDGLRERMAMTCWERWKSESETRCTTLMPTLETNYDFQLQRRQMAADLAESDIYVVADDDCLPERPEPFVTNCRLLMERYPEFAVLSLWPSNSVLHPWKADDIPGYEPVLDEAVLEHVSVGGIRFCRKEAFRDLDWPEQELKSYDAQEAAALRKAGFRVGYFRNFYMNHLGRHYSTIWP